MNFEESRHLAHSIRCSIHQLDKLKKEIESTTNCLQDILKKL